MWNEHNNVKDLPSTNTVRGLKAKIELGASELQFQRSEIKRKT